MATLPGMEFSSWTSVPSISKTLMSPEPSLSKLVLGSVLQSMTGDNDSSVDLNKQWYGQGTPAPSKSTSAVAPPSIQTLSPTPVIPGQSQTTSLLPATNVSQQIENDWGFK
jgi:hypothetical protein